MDGNPDNLITAGLVSMVVVVSLAVYLCRVLEQDAHRYTAGVKRAQRRLAKKLSQAVCLPPTSTDLLLVEGEVNAALMNIEDVAGKIEDDAVRVQLELSFMVVRGALPDLPIRVCVEDTIFCFSEGNYNQQAVMKSFNDFNDALLKLKKL